MPSKNLVREVTLLDYDLSERLKEASHRTDLGKATIIRRALRFFLNENYIEFFDHHIANAHDITD